MKKLFTLLICIGLVLSCAKPKPDQPFNRDESKPTVSAPTGFLDWRWGEKENVFSKRECRYDVENSKVFYELGAYKCFEPKQVDGVTGMEYRLKFYREQFFMGTLIFHKAHLDNLTRNLHAKYGPPSKVEAPRDIFNPNVEKTARWNVGNTLIIVKHSQYDNRAELSYIFLPAAASINYRLEQDNEELLFEE